MNTTHCAKACGVLLGAALFTGLGFIPYAAAQIYLIDIDTRTATELGSFGGWPTLPRALNDSGQVAGLSATDFRARAFITGPDGVGMRDLGDLAPYSYSSAYGINDAAQVVGVSVTANRQSHAFITGANGMGMRDLGTLGGNYSYAFSINDTGQVVGYSGTTEGNTRAFISGPNGAGLTNLGTLFDSINSKLGVSHAYDINDAGQVVGRSVSRWGSDHAFITGADGAGMSDLGTLSGDLSDLSVAHSINNTGRVVGYSATSSGTYHAFITGPDGVGMRDLGTLGGNDSSALGINDAGQAVGRSRMSWGTDHAFITSADGIGMTDLNSLVDLPGGIILTDAVDINNVGQVIAFGVIPEPEAYALFLAGLGLMGVITSRNRLLV